MSANPTPPPLPAPVPAPAPKGGSGCLPFFVFLLVLALAACVFLEKKWPNLPREYAGQVTVEVLDSPSKERMKNLSRRVLTGAVLGKALLNTGTDRNMIEAELPKLRERVNVKTAGTFLTITVYGGQRELHKMAGAIAQAFNEDLIEEVITVRKLRSQAVEVNISMFAEYAERARANLLDITKKHSLHPDGTSTQEDAPQKGVAQRLAKVSLDLALLEEQQKLLAGEDLKRADGVVALLNKVSGPSRALLDWQAAQKDAAQEGAPPEAAKLAEDKKNELKRQFAHARDALDQQKALLESERKVLTATRDAQLAEELSTEQRRGDWREARAEYDRNLAFVNKLRDEATQARVDHSVVLHPMRTVDEADEIRVPARKTLQGLKAITAICAVLLIACLLTAITKRLCRRA